MPKVRQYILKDFYEGEKIKVESNNRYYNYNVYEFLRENKKGQYVYMYAGSSEFKEPMKIKESR